jgi:localization factor PodJL
MASESNWKAAEDESAGGEQPPVEALIRKLMARVEESERRYSETLEDLHMRLDQLSQATVAAKSASASADSEVLDRLHEQVSSLAKRLSQGGQAPSAKPDENIFDNFARGSEPFGGLEGDIDFGGREAAGDAFTQGPGALAGDNFLMLDQASGGFEQAAPEPAPPPKIELPLLLPDKEETLPSAHDDLLGDFGESGLGESGFGESASSDSALGETDFGQGDFGGAAPHFGMRATPSDASREAVERSLAYGADDASRLINAARRLESSLGSVVPNEQIAELNAKMTDIAAALDRALQQNDGAAPQASALQQIEDQIAELAQQLGRAEQEIARIGGVEDQLGRLAKEFEAQPARFEDIAQRAATEAAERVSGEIRTHAAERFEAIRQDLTAMNDRNATSEGRLTESLNAVQDSLRKLAAQAERPSAPGPRRAPFSNTSAARPEMRRDQAAGASAAPPPLAPRAAPMPETRERPDNSLRSQLAAILPDDEEAPAPIFTKSGDWPDDQTGPAKRRPRKPQASDQEAPDSFVAAARRAAKAAAEKAERKAAASWTGKAKAAKSKILPGETAVSDAAPSRKKRSYLMFVAVILLIVSACLLYSRLRHKEVAAPSATEQSAPASKPAAPGAAAAPKKSSSISLPGLGYLDQDDRPGNDVPKTDNGSAPSTPTLAPQPVSLRSDDNEGLAPGVSLTITQPQSPLPGNNAAAAPAKPDAASLPLAPADAGPYALRAAASQGDPKAEYFLGLHYADANGPAQNMPEAARWFRLAALAGLAPAQYRLGVLYERGEGVDFDLGMAQNWYLRAARRGNIKAMHNLAVILGGQNGDGDYRTAAQWYAKAAAHGLADSQFNLGVLKEHGLGVGKNLPEAYQWFALAAAQNDADAASRRDDVARILTTAQLQSAKAAVEAWKPEPVDPNANTVTPDPDWVAAASPPSPDQVKQAQALLNQLGYDAGAADGQFGDRTKAAVLSFERKNGLPETGVVDGKLIVRLQKLSG